MIKEKITSKRGTEIYKVTTDKKVTDNELINFCDCNNFGGYVTKKANNIYIVEIFID